MFNDLLRRMGTPHVVTPIANRAGLAWPPQAHWRINSGYLETSDHFAMLQEAKSETTDGRSVGALATRVTTSQEELQHFIRREIV